MVDTSHPALVVPEGVLTPGSSFSGLSLRHEAPFARSPVYGSPVSALLKELKAPRACFPSARSMPGPGEITTIANSMRSKRTTSTTPPIIKAQGVPVVKAPKNVSVVFGRQSVLT